MRCKAILIILLLLVSFVSVSAEKTIPLIINVTLSDGTPIAGVLVNISMDDVFVESGVTDENGQVIFQLPGNKTYTIIVSYGVWNDSKTIYLNHTTVVNFVAKYGLPIETYTLPLRLTIWTPGGFILTFEKADNVSANVVTFKPGTEYTLIVKNNIIKFEANVSDIYIIDIDVSYRRLDWYSGSLITYSKTAFLKTVQGFSFYSKNLKILATVEAIVGPHYPTPEEVAAAQTKLLMEFKNDIIKEIAQLNTKLYVEFKNLSRTVYQSSNSTTNLLSSFSDALTTTTNEMYRLFGNTWIGLILISSFLVVIGISMLALYRSREEVIITAELEKPKKRKRKKAGGSIWPIVFVVFMAGLAISILLHFFFDIPIFDWFLEFLRRLI